MEMTASFLAWFLVTFSIGIPLLFIVGVRYAASRLAGRAASSPATAIDVLAFPTPRFASFWQVLRTLTLMVVLGIGAGAVLLRFGYGLGEVTHLSNRFPWGLWIGFDVMGGVALAAGAFVVAGLAHVFGLKRFEPLVRPALLTGLLGYLLAIGGLMVDLGRPYNVWRPLVHWQRHSVMWEVGLCVASYTTVLFIEFLPVLLERANRFKAVTRRLPT
ncbi:MAG: NrfD/PsrC family molybdoenzyme membrane anchor subunit, partial [Chloroflexota bacterium]